jgi:hypothetical protein
LKSPWLSAILFQPAFSWSFVMMSRRMAHRSVALALLMTASASAAAGAQDAVKGGERTVTVAATGSAAAAPDRAAITTGVMAEAATARDAMAANSTAMRRLIDGLKALGIDAKDIQTTSVNVNPRYGEGRTGKAPTITGYQAINQVRLIVRDLKKLGEVLDQALALGANQMGGIAFEVSTAEALKDDARRDAMANARRRAELYALAAGTTVGNVLSISEVASGPVPRMFGGGRAAMAEAVPVEAGSVDLTVQVQVTWALR